MKSCDVPACYGKEDSYKEKNSVCKCGKFICSKCKTTLFNGSWESATKVNILPFSVNGSFLCPFCHLHEIVLKSE